MNKTNALSVLLLLLLLACVHFGMPREPPTFESQNLTTFSEAKGRPEPFPSVFEFSTATHKYRISGSGRGKRTDRRASARSFNLRLGRGLRLERAIFHTEYQRDLLLICEITDEESGAGFITRLDGRTLRTKWKLEIPGFNVGQGLIEGDYAYVTAIGFIGKVTLASGVYTWRHDDLYGQNDTFNSFQLPRIQGEVALFTEVFNRPAKTITVNKRTGKILSIG